MAWMEIRPEGFAPECSSPQTPSRRLLAGARCSVSLPPLRPKLHRPQARPGVKHRSRKEVLNSIQELCPHTKASALHLGLHFPPIRSLLSTALLLQPTNPSSSLSLLISARVPRNNHRQNARKEVHPSSHQGLCASQPHPCRWYPRPRYFLHCAEAS
jgi:hypothetical protein